MQLVMFDIDGTLVDSHDFDGPLYAQAVTDVLGVSVDTTWSSYKNVTDTGIVQELAIRAGRAEESSEIQSRVKRRFLELCQEYLTVAPSALREIPGASGLVKTLHELPDVQVAIATGGFQESAWLKLQEIGINPEEYPIATASDAFERTNIMQLAETRAARNRAFLRVTYFGDGIWDQRASEALGYDFIAVGRNVPHHTVFPDLQDHAEILKRLGINQL